MTCFSKHPPMFVTVLDPSSNPPPQVGGKKYNLGDLEIEECKLELRNAKTRGVPSTKGPPFVGGEGPENSGQKAQQKKTGLGKCKCTPPSSGGGGAGTSFPQCGKRSSPFPPTSLCAKRMGGFFQKSILLRTGMAVVPGTSPPPSCGPWQRPRPGPRRTWCCLHRARRPFSIQAFIESFARM